MRWRRFDELSLAQLYELLAFRQAIFVVEQGSPYADLDGRDQAAWHLLLRRGGMLAGYLRLLPGPPVSVGRVAVDPACRGQGLGRRLVEAALQACRDRHPGQPVALSAQSYLVPFYESLGFAPVSEPYDDCGVMHVDMRKEG